MHLNQREQDRLLLFLAAELARRRLARGRRLSGKEAIALVCDEMVERAWDGASYDEVVEHGRSVLRRDQLVDGVPETVRHIEVEALFPSGTALLSLDDPFGTPAYDMVEPGPGSIEINPDRPRVEVEVRNTAAQPVYVTSHFHFAEVNQALRFDRDKARGTRLDVPAGTAVGWAPGETRSVVLVPYRRETQ